MLVLERREGEAVILTIGETRIRIEIDRARDGRAKVAIDAPQEVNIEREEIAG